MAIALSSYVGRAAAAKPSIVSIENISAKLYDRIDAKIDVQIRHDNPSKSHYVDIVEYDFMDSVAQVKLDPQTTSPFNVIIPLGAIAGGGAVGGEEPPVKVRAHCTVDGWGDWSNPVTVPEFPIAPIAAFVALAASLIVINRKR